MNQSRPPSPTAKPQNQNKANSPKKERLAKALRQNLLRRKSPKA